MAGEQQLDQVPQDSKQVNESQFRKIDPGQLDRFAEKSGIKSDALLSVDDTRLIEDETYIEHQKSTLYRILDSLRSDSDAPQRPSETIETALLTHQQLAVLYERVAGQTENPEKSEELIRDAIQHQQKALGELDRLVEIDDTYAVDRAFPELELATLKCYLDADRNCLETLRSIIDRYENTSYGAYPEWFVTNTVIPAFYQYAERSGQTELRRYAVDELHELSNRPDAIGASASIMLVRHYMGENQFDSAERVLKRTTFNVRELPQDVQGRWQIIETVYDNARERRPEG